jgi:hypothetical protein
MTAPILTVTWDTVIGARQTDSGDYDEPPAYEPVSLGEAVTDALAAQLRSQIDKQAEEIRLRAYREMSQHIADVRTEVIREQVTAMVREQLTKPIQKTNSWGEATGDPTTLTDLITKEVRDYLQEKAPRRGYSDREREGGLLQLLRVAVTDAMQKELKAEIEKARAAVRAEVAAKAGEMFGDVLKQATR